jgi:hypothetical protein
MYLFEWWNLEVLLDDDFILSLITCKYKCTHTVGTLLYILIILPCWRTSQILEWWVNDLSVSSIISALISYNFIIKNYVYRKITSYIYLLIFTKSLWLHVKHFIALYNIRYRLHDGTALSEDLLIAGIIREWIIPFVSSHWRVTKNGVYLSFDIYKIIMTSCQTFYCTNEKGRCENDCFL